MVTLNIFKIGNIRLGWTNGYKMFLSTDGGATWLDSDSDGTNDSIFNGANQTYTKNVKVTVNTATGVASLWFDGTKDRRLYYRKRGKCC